MDVQFESVVEVLKVLHQNHDFILLFDKYDGHGKKIVHGIDNLLMNSIFGYHTDIVCQKLSWCSVQTHAQIPHGYNRLGSVLFLVVGIGIVSSKSLLW